MSATALIVNADDYGLTDATCDAVLEAHRTGIVTSTSVLAVVPGVAARMHRLDDAPELAVGVHLALVGEDPPLLAASEVPSLVDGSGRFPADWRALVRRAALGRVDPADVRRELDAQIELVAQLRAPTHLDAHQHVHLWPSIGRVVRDLAVAHGISAVRVPRPTSGGPRSWAIARLATRLERTCGSDLARSERFRGLDEAGGWTAASLVAALEALAVEPHGGRVEINVHPGAHADPGRSRYAWGYGWGAELDALTDPEVRSTVDRLGFSLVGR